MRWMATLKQPLSNGGDTEKIYKLMMDETESGTYIYLYIWPKNHASYDEWYVDKEEAMSAYADQIDEKGWRPVQYYNILKEITMLELCFPKELKSKVEYVEKQILNKCRKDLSICFQQSSWRLLNGEDIFLPSRIYSKDINHLFNNDEEIDHFFDHDHDAKLIMHCLMTRNTNGFIREKHVRCLLDTDYTEWCIPYIFELSTEYVKEILEIINDKLKNKDMEIFRKVLNMNPKNFSRGYGKMVNYCPFNLRNFVYGHSIYRFSEYVGYDLFYNKYGFTREKDYRVKHISKLNKKMENSK